MTAEPIDVVLPAGSAMGCDKPEHDTTSDGQAPPELWALAREPLLEVERVGSWGGTTRSIAAADTRGEACRPRTPE